MTSRLLALGALIALAGSLALVSISDEARAEAAPPEAHALLCDNAFHHLNELKCEDLAIDPKECVAQRNLIDQHCPKTQRGRHQEDLNRSAIANSRLLDACRSRLNALRYQVREAGSCSGALAHQCSDTIALCGAVTSHPSEMAAALKEIDDWKKGHVPKGPEVHVSGVGNCETLSDGKKRCYRLTCDTTGNAVCYAREQGAHDAGDPGGLSSDWLNEWPVARAFCDGEPQARFAEDRKFYIDKGYSVNCGAKRTTHETEDSSQKLKAEIAKYCQDNLDYFASSALAGNRFGVKGGYARLLADCRGLLDAEAAKLGIDLPSADDSILDFALQIARTRMPDKWNAWDLEQTNQCKRNIVNLESLDRNRPPTEEMAKTDAFKTFPKEYEEAKEAVVGNQRCRRLCFDSAACLKLLVDPSKPVMVRRTDGVCVEVPANQVAQLGAGVILLFTPAEMMRYCRNQIGAGPVRPPAAPDERSETRPSCPPGFSPMMRLGFQWCASYDISADGCRQAGGVMQPISTGTGGFRDVCVGPLGMADMANVPSSGTPSEPATPGPGVVPPSVRPQGPQPPGTTRSGRANDPNFRRMCAEAQLHSDTCAQRERRYRPDDRRDSGYFAECVKAYEIALRECRQEGVLPGSARSTPQPGAASPPTKPPETRATDKGTPGQSRPPDKTPPKAAAAQPEMSAQCQKLVGDYVAAAQAKDGARALAGYNALKRAGGCGVLQRVDRPPPVAKKKAPPADDPRFVARGATPLSDAVVGSCDASPAECEARVRRLRAGTSDEAKAALTMHAIGVGLELGTMLGNGMVGAVPGARNIGVPTRNTDMRSLAGPIIRSRPAQGAPSGPVQRNTPSDIRMQ